MNCADVEDLLTSYVEGELDDDQRGAVDAHTTTCEDCRAALQETRELLEAFSALKERDPASIAAGATPDGAPELGWRAGDRFGDFELIEELGRGGMGAVYRARQVSLGRIVALKVLPRGVAGDATSAERFRREAHAAARLHHGNIVAVHTLAAHESCPFYVMELIDGCSLAEALKRGDGSVSLDASQLTTQAVTARPPVSASRLDLSAPPARTGAPHSASPNESASVPGIPESRRGGAYFRKLARLFAEVADGLDYAHRMGVVHRDIKPHNLMLGDDGRLHITDFGLARLFDEPGVTRSGEMIGTPAYMSPEQIGARRGAIGPSSDIYSLGVTLYECLTGRRPFAGETREQLVTRIARDEPRAPRAIRRDVPRDLETICLRAMQKTPVERYASAGDMAADLRRYADGLTIRSRRIGALERAAKWVRRRPAVAASIALAAIILMGGVGWTIQARRQRIATANDLVQKAFDELAFLDYRNTRAPLEWLEAAAPLQPDPLRYRLAMGLAHLRADPPVAVGHLEEALKRSPGHVEGMCLLAWALEKNAQDDAQAQWLERIEQAGGPDTAAGWFFLGQAVVRQDPNRANNAFRRAIDLRAQYYQAIIHLARAQNHEMYHRRTTYDFGEIRSRLELACQAQSRAAYPCYLLSLAYRLSAEIYRDAGRADEAAPRFDNARKWAEEAITREPTSPRGFAALAEYHESLGAYENAIAAWERAEPHCSAIPDEYELREYRWRLLLWAGRHDEALRDIDRLEQLDGASDADHPWMARWFRAVLLADRGEFDRATNELHAVMRDHADSRRARVDCLTLMRWIGHATNAPVAISHRGDSPELIGSLSPAVSPAASEAVVRLCDGDAELSQIESDVAAFPSDNKRVWAPVWFVQSGRMAATGHRDRAIAALRACRDCYDDEHYCYRAKLLLALLRDRPEWPS